MLVFTRHTGQRIHVGGNVVITVLCSNQGKVRLGIEAPPEVAVDREEIFERKQNERGEGALLPRQPR